MNVKQVLREVVIWSAFAASGGHIYQVAYDMGNPPWIAAVHAIGLDGLVYIGIIAYSTGAKVRGALAVVYGGAVSLAFNAAAYSDGHHLPVWVMAMSMPVSLVLGVLVGHGVMDEIKPVRLTPTTTARPPTPRKPQAAPEMHPVPRPQPNPPEHVQSAKPAEPKREPDRRPQGVHVRAGIAMRGTALKADAIALVRGEGLSNADLAASYDPPLKPRTAEAFGAEARRPMNGHAPAVEVS